MRPIVPTGRVVGLDIARCLALLGMIATHVLVSTNADGSTTVVQQLAGGRSAALFALLAGTSLALMSGRTVPVRGTNRAAVSAGLAARALLIAVLGLLLGELQSGIAIILTYYGLLFLLGLPFLRMKARSLAVLSGAWLVVVPVLSHLLRPHLPDRGFQSPSFGALAEPWQLLTELTFTGYYPVVTWLAYLLAGMAIGRMDLSAWRTTVWLAAAGAALAAVSWAGSALLVGRPGVMATLEETFTGPGMRQTMEDTLTHGLYGSTPTESWWWLTVSAPHSGTAFDFAHTIGSALLVIGLSLALGRLLPRLTAVVFGAGAMTLTLYSLHVMMRTPGLWFDDGADTYAKHVTLVLVIGATYRLIGQRGPLERGVAALSDTAAKAVRRTSATSSRT